MEIYDTASEPVSDHRENPRWMEIFMPLKEGSLKTLASRPGGPGIDTVELAKSVLEQMLKALRCTATYDIIHRDIKPDKFVLPIPNYTSYILIFSQYPV